MKRTRQHKKPDAILCSDFHLREDQPTCRTDNFWEVQWNKVDFIKELQMKYNCPVLHAGDLFHNWKPSPYLLSETIQHLPGDFWTVYGQHDLPQHNLDLAHKCGINTLKSAKLLHVMIECHWGRNPTKASLFFPVLDIKMLVWHIMTYQGKKPWPDCTDPVATKLLRKYPQYDLIVTGDNHKSFVEEYEGRILVNPGSIMRMTADQIDHRPCVYLWYAETNTVKPVYLPIESDVITREHIERKERQDKRIDAFVSRLRKDFVKNYGGLHDSAGRWYDPKTDTFVGFEENLERFAKINKVRESVMEIVNKAIEL